MSEREGPEVKRDCSGCKWLESEYYRVQGDSGHDHMCRHPSVADKPQSDRLIGDCRTVTPDWCPVLSASQQQEAPRMGAGIPPDAAASMPAHEREPPHCPRTGATVMTEQRTSNPVAHG